MSHFIVEQWKEFIPKENGKKRYFVSNYGKVKSCDKEAVIDKNTSFTMLKGAKIGDFLSLRLTYYTPNGQRKIATYFFHHMVAELFLKKENVERTFLVHLDYDVKNNVVTNLAWATRAEMYKHVHSNPALKEVIQKNIENNRKSDGKKLTVTEAIRLKKKLLDPNRKNRYKMLAKEFNVSLMTLHRIKSGENWGHLEV